jgi:hypothetical protein
MVKTDGLRVDIDGLRQQQWRAARLFRELVGYAERIGCTVEADIIYATTNEQARLLAAWWIEHTGEGQ